MTGFYFKRVLVTLFIFTLFCGCDRLYENVSDIQSQKAMQDLIIIQEDYHKKNNRFAKNLTEIKDAGFQLEYHTGLVYVEIESASETGWRAVSLPAESPTARVFAFDTNKGGYYEMEDEEVAGYVLGALHHIRAAKIESQMRDRVGFVLVGIMALFGLRTWWRNRVPGSGRLGWPFVLSLPPLLFGAMTLNHMHQEIVLSETLKSLLIGSVALALICVMATITGFKKVQRGETLTPLSALAVCTILISIVNILVVTHTFMNYSENPDPYEKFTRPEGRSLQSGFGVR